MSRKYITWSKLGILVMPSRKPDQKDWMYLSWQGWNFCQFLWASFCSDGVSTTKSQFCWSDLLLLRRLHIFLRHTKSKEFFDKLVSLQNIFIFEPWKYLFQHVHEHLKFPEWCKIRAPIICPLHMCAKKWVWNVTPARHLTCKLQNLGNFAGKKLINFSA